MKSRRVQVAYLAVLLLLTGCSDAVVGGGEGDIGQTLDAVTAPDSTPPSCQGLDDGAACDDGNPCTLDDRCGSGVCAGSTSNPCDDEGPCRPGTCDPAEGCVYSTEVDDTPCSVACFGSATCQQGECVVDAESAVVCPRPDAPCVEKLQWEAATGACTREIYKSEGAPCDTDQNWCLLEACDGQGTCVDQQEQASCSAQTAADQCWTFECDPIDGECKGVLFIEGVSCDDGNPCTLNDQCVVDPIFKESCIGEPLPVDDGNPCTDDKCVGGVVEHVILDGVGCEDGDPCTVEELCEDGACVPHGIADTCPVPCETTDECIDDDLCTMESCDDGYCSSSPVKCDDQDPCTIDACNDGECSSVPLPCQDSDPCTQDTCLEGECVFNELICDDEEPCTTNGCQDGQCVFTPFSCEDDDPCTTDICVEDGCAFEPMDCNADSPCMFGYCEEGACLFDFGDLTMVGACLEVPLAEPVHCDANIPDFAEQPSAEFSPLGFDQEFTVPEGVTLLFVKAWGGGGGSWIAGQCGAGGGAGFAYAELEVTPGETLTVLVGEGGKDGFYSWGSGTEPAPDEPAHYGGGGLGGLHAGNGGGRSAIRRGDDELLTAAGGGCRRQGGTRGCHHGAQGRAAAHPPATGCQARGGRGTSAGETRCCGCRSGGSDSSLTRARQGAPRAKHGHDPARCRGKKSVRLHTKPWGSNCAAGICGA